MLKRAVVTGATGSVGNGLIHELLEDNYEILLLVREESERNKYIPKSNNIRVEYCSLQGIALFDEKKIDNYDVFFHLGWGGTIGNERDDVKVQYDNIGYTLDAVDLAKRLGCRTFVGVGSQAEYGRHNCKLSCNTDCKPETSYGTAKLCAGQMSRILSNQYGMRHVWARLLTVYGPQDGNHGFVIPTIDKINRNKVPTFTKGEQVWDFLYYKDAGRGIKLIGEKGIDGKTYVLGCGKERKLFEYINEMNEVLAPYTRFDIGGLAYAENQIMYLCADNTEITKDTGWKPKVSFKEGIEKVKTIYEGYGK